MKGEQSSSYLELGHIILSLDLQFVNIVVGIIVILDRLEQLELVVPALRDLLVELLDDLLVSGIVHLSELEQDFQNDQ